MSFEDRFRAMVTRYVGRAWRRADGLPSSAVDAAERRLGCSLPAALRAFHRTLGRLDALCTVQNRIRTPEDLAFEEGYLIFMDENQDVVTWGIRREDLDQPDPPTWQRNNTPPTAWFAEDKSFVELLESMFDWYAEMGVLRRS